eukprot:CAMPEP_0171697060 /NCGR_PEP_ID=MMETSP0991-20121206/8617_1 /TAXON_ID=483369 /ORGANISM="non described non described, Strain CCMP2098" /LENGTH=108 /DNA_ID=CAMNT_0012285823 /DNA_START=124 /DNA_END=451 /DNA_ORIENTATION=+
MAQPTSIAAYLAFGTAAPFFLRLFASLLSMRWLVAVGGGHDDRGAVPVSLVLSPPECAAGVADGAMAWAAGANGVSSEAESRGADLFWCAAGDCASAADARACVVHRL